MIIHGWIKHSSHFVFYVAFAFAYSLVSALEKLNDQQIPGCSEEAGVYCDVLMAIESHGEDLQCPLKERLANA